MVTGEELGSQKSNRTNPKASKIQHLNKPKQKQKQTLNPTSSKLKPNIFLHFSHFFAQQLPQKPKTPKRFSTTHPVSTEQGIRLQAPETRLRLLPVGAHLRGEDLGIAAKTSSQKEFLRQRTYCLTCCFSCFLLL